MEKLLFSVTSKNTEQTQIFAQNFAKSIKVPTVINLVGDLGSGKTTFTQGFIKGLGITDYVTSPTFTLLNEYYKDFPVYHFDMYRIENPEETQQLGFEEYFDLNCLQGVTLVEWAEKTPHLLPSSYIKIQIKKIDDTTREFVVSSVQQ